MFQSRDFRTHSRTHNNLFAFTAMGVSGDQGFVHQPVLSCVKIHGRTYHRTCAEMRGPVHWYVHDPDQRREEATNFSVDHQLVDAIQQTLATINPYARSPCDEGSTYSGVLEEKPTGPNFHQPPQRAVRTTTVPAFLSPRHQRLVPTNDLRPNTFCQDHTARTLPPSCLDRGEVRSAWAAAERISCGYVQQCGRHQTELHSTERPDQDRSTERAGRNHRCRRWTPCRTGVSTSFLHGITKNAKDGMAVVRRLGKPTYFITVTCNPNWPEIQNHPDIHGQNASDRPDLTCHFKEKLHYILEALRNGLLGRKVYVMYVVEFQKRGLPHAHIALSVTPQPQTTEQIDDIISAETPPESTDKEDQRYRELVLRHMVHGHTKACRDEEGHCRKKFPKPVTETTYTNDRGYTHYRRRTPQDTKIVPHNRHLLLLGESHINVEVSCTVNLIMYLYKYIFKGPDHARYSVGDSVDEIQDYLKARYLSASEAAWRIFGFHVNYRDPSVTSLPIHLLSREFVIFQEGNEQVAAATSCLNCSATSADLWTQHSTHSTTASTSSSSLLERVNLERLRQAGWIKYLTGHTMSTADKGDSTSAASPTAAMFST